jgi:hypothetical protein
MQTSTEDDHVAANRGIAGERNVAAEDENVSGHRTVEKNISGENTHAAGGSPVNLGGTENAAGIMEPLVWREDNVPANVEYVR